MRRTVRLVAFGLVVLMAASPVWAASLTGRVTSINTDQRMFILDREGKETKLWISPKASEGLKAQFGQLKVGDSVKVDYDSELSQVRVMEVLPAPIK